MKYYVITSNYDYDTNDINLYCRDERGKKVKKVITKFDPKFYIRPHDVETYRNDPRILEFVTDAGYKYFRDRSDVVQVITYKPKFVGDIRKEFKIPCYEADIPFPRRFMIDHDVMTGFIADEKRNTYYPDGIKPIDCMLKPRIAFFDIENLLTERKVIINCIYDNKKKIYFSIALDPNGRRDEKLSYAKNHIVYIVRTEEELLQLTEKFFKVVDPDVSTAWWIEHDKNYLDERNKKTKTYIPWERSNVLDLLEVYKMLYNKGSGKLKDVVKAEKLNIPNYEPFQQRFWYEDLEKAILVNKSHVEALVELDKKLKIIDFFWNLKEISGYEDINGTIHHGSIIDLLLLRFYHRNKLVLDSKPKGKDLEENYRLSEGKKVGGKVFDPPYGIFKHIAVFDMSRYYPELLISQNLTFEPVLEGELGVLPQIALYFIEERLKFDAELDKMTPGTLEYKLMKERRDAVKFVLNTIFGSTGHELGRGFDLNIFNGITVKGQEGLSFLRTKAREDGNNVIYGDTDSTFLQMPTNDVAMQSVLPQYQGEVDELLENGVDSSLVYTVVYAIHYTERLNEFLKEFTKLHNLNRDLELKLEYLFATVLFKKVVERVEGKVIERGAKKRYAGRVKFHGKPVDYLHIKGFEYVRKDSAFKTRDVQPKVFDLLLSDRLEDAKTLVRKTTQGLYKEYEEKTIDYDDIAIPKKLSVNPWDYGGKDKNGRRLTPPEYARGALYANEWLGETIRAEDQVKMLFVESMRGYPPTKVICYTDKSNLPDTLVVDIDHQVKRILRMPLEAIFGSIDIKWDDLFFDRKGIL